MSKPAGVSFHVDHHPVSVNRRYVGRTYTLSAMYRDFHHAVSTKAREAMRGRARLEGPLRAELVFLFASPLSDIDGPIKPVLDGLNGIVFDDDRQIVEVKVNKHVVPDRDEAGVSVCVMETA